MKKSLVVLAAMAFFIVMVSGAFAAGSITPTIDAKLNVKTVCVAGGTGVIDFGSFDATDTYTSDVALTGMTLWCTKGSGYVQVSVGGAGASYAGNLVGQTTPGDTIGYAITCTSGCSSAVDGKGKSTDLIADGTVAMHGNITALALDDVSAQDYKETVTLTITY